MANEGFFNHHGFLAIPRGYLSVSNKEGVSRQHKEGRNSQEVCTEGCHDQFQGHKWPVSVQEENQRRHPDPVKGGTRHAVKDCSAQKGREKRSNAPVARWCARLDNCIKFI